MSIARGRALELEIMASSLADALRIKPGSRVHLDRRDTDAPAGWTKERARERTEHILAELPDWQYKLYIENRRALLIILQAMDAGGKDGVIRRVMAVLNPQGCRVTSFKAPTAIELAHDFLWRVHAAVPARGEVGIFNRSHYEDVLIVRVKNLVPREVWSRRYEQINNFERMLAENDVTILKFFLHISKEEQRERLQERLDDPAKHWKVNPADLVERKRWDEYQRAYEVALEQCSTPWAPWYVVPADRKWFRDYAVATIIRDTFRAMDPQLPPPRADFHQIVVE